MHSVVLCQPSLLSPTAKTDVCHVAKPFVSTPRPTIVPPVAEPLVVTPPVFDDSNVAVAESSALPIAVANTSTTNLSSSAKPSVPKLFHPHQYEPDQLNELIQTTAQQFSSST